MSTFDQTLKNAKTSCSFIFTDPLRFLGAVRPGCRLLKKWATILLLVILPSLTFNCQPEEAVGPFPVDIRPMSGLVGLSFKEEVTVNQVYSYASIFSNGIQSINGLGYYSKLPNDSLKYIINNLEELGYSDATVKIVAETNRIEISAYFSDATDSQSNVNELIKGWIDLSKKTNLKLEEIQSNKNVLLLIPPGLEKIWVNLHKADQEIAAVIFPQ